MKKPPTARSGRAPKAAAPPTPSNNNLVRVNKLLADRGLASRRESDELITKKQVLVDGQPAVIGQKVSPDAHVEITGKTKAKQYFLYYKGRGIITHSPTEKETDILSKLKKDYGISGVYPVGRLDKDSEGLIILTNDGRITGPLLDPEANHEKEYQVSVDKTVGASFCKLMELGVNIEGYQTKPARVIPSLKNTKNFNLIITEGKKHQIRRMCAALGYQVQSLKRVRVLNLELKNLKPNQYRKISEPELKVFLKSLGLQ